jgi:hypothetical protein
MEKIKQFWFALTHWEKWHYNVKYALLSPIWIWYSLRARSLYFFTPANPTLTFGGLEGGPKKEIYDLLPKEMYPTSIYIDPGLPLQQIETMMSKNGLAYPVAVKPNIGMMGLLFRKIDNAKELAIYHQTMKVTYILQELINYPIEVSVFYYRMPNKIRGTITGFVKKEALEVMGDGKSTLEVLLQQLQHRPGFYYNEWAIKHNKILSNIIPKGEVFKISWVANLSRGARLISLANEKDEKLLAFFDKLSHGTKHLYYGRYDIKCKSIEDLKQGRHLSILEFNGTGAEPHHMYGNKNSFFQAAKIIVHHWHMLFNIAKYHNKQGVPYRSFKEGVRFTRSANRHFKQLKELDKQMPVFH